MQYTIVDDGVVTAPIYKCDGKTSQHVRPCKNHDLYIDHIPTQTQSQCKKQTQSSVIPA